MVVPRVVNRSGRIGALVEDVNNYGVRGEVVRGASVISGVRMARGQDGEGGVTRSEGNVKIDVVIYHAAVVIPRRKEAAGSCSYHSGVKHAIAQAVL